MDPLDYLRVLQRRWYVWLGVLALALAAAWLSLPRGDERVSRGPLATSYTATHTLLQGPDVQNPVNLPLTRLFATTGEIPRLAAVALGRPADEGPQVAARVSVTLDPEVAALRITSTGTDGDEAARTANAFGESIKTYLRDRADADRGTEAADLQSRLSGLQDRILQLQRQLAGNPLETPILEAQQTALTNQYQSTFERLQSLQAQPAATSPLDTLEAAVPIQTVATGSPVPTSARGRLGLALVLGLVLGLALALGIDRLDKRMRTRGEVEEATGLPVVAEIPRLPRTKRGVTEIVTAVAPRSGAAEAYRGLRATVLLVPSRVVAEGATAPAPIDLSTWQPPQVLLVTSPGPADGKTSTVVNLAAAMAESGRSVIVIDGDFRKPNADRYLGVVRSPGLSNLLEGSVSGGLAGLLRPTALDDVLLLPSGTSSRTPGEMLSSFGEVIAQARTTADVVIVDAAPMLAANDATDIVPHVDTVLLVTQTGRTSAPAAERTVDLLARLAVPVLGVVVQAAGEADSLGSYEGYGTSRGDDQDQERGDAGHGAAVSKTRLSRKVSAGKPRSGTGGAATTARTVRTFHAKRT